jgi:LysR family transcriptional regulator, transcriptional activator for dmlA
MEETRMSAGSILAWLQGRIASVQQINNAVLAAYAEMNMDKITDLNDVRTFVIASRTGSLSAAALELGKPTSTVSRALTRLEQDLGVLLIRRGSRGLTLTDDGEGYLSACKRALRSLHEGGLGLKVHQSNPSGLLKIACPVTFGRDMFAPLLPVFLDRYPELYLEIELYASGWDQEPRENVDVFFKLRAPRDSHRIVRAYPGAARGLFASAEYLKRFGSPKDPQELTRHACTGSGTWKLTRASNSVTPVVRFRVNATDPYVHLSFVQKGLGIAALPLFMTKWPENRKFLVPVLPLWKPEPIVLCALYTGHSRLTPKVHALLEFLDEYVGTDRDPRLRNEKLKGDFTDRTLPQTFSP